MAHQKRSQGLPTAPKGERVQRKTWGGELEEKGGKKGGLKNIVKLSIAPVLWGFGMEEKSRGANNKGWSYLLNPRGGGVRKKKKGVLPKEGPTVGSGKQCKLTPAVTSTKTCKGSHLTGFLGPGDKTVKQERNKNAKESIGYRKKRGQSEPLRLWGVSLNWKVPLGRF